MVGAISAAGLMGGLAMVLAQIQKQHPTLQKRTQSSVELEALSQRISRILYNPDACLNTIRNTTPSTPAFTNGSSFPVSSIKNANGTDVIEVANSTTGLPTYGNGLIKINSIQLRSNTVTSTGAQFTLAVTMEKTSRAITGYRQANRNYRLTAVLNSGQPSQCQTDLSVALLQAQNEFCSELGGTVDTSTLACSIANATTSTNTNTMQCPNANEFPIGFEPTLSDGRLQIKCAPVVAPPVAHPTGFNCFHLAAYAGDHGQANALFQEADATALSDENEHIIANRNFLRATDFNRLRRWILNPACTPPTTPVADPYPNIPPSYTCTISGTDHTVYRCPSGYTDLFINPMGAIVDFPNPDYNTLHPHKVFAGAYVAYMQHHCCQ